jgi:ribonuclease HI
VQILVVANKNGHDKFFDATKFPALEAAIQAHGRHANEATSWQLFAKHPVAKQHAGTISLSQQFRAKQPEKARPRPSQQMLLPFAAALPSALRKLKWDNDSILFTDGSAKDGKAGAGVTLLAPGAPVVVKQRLRGNRTSLAAELAGIARAAEIANDEDVTAAIETGEIEGVVIASDCDVAITLIENAMYDDTSMCGAPEEDKRPSRPAPLTDGQLRRALGALQDQAEILGGLIGGRTDL